MKKRKVYLALVPLVLIGAVAGWRLTSEPAYRGRSLSQWVASYSYSSDRGRYTPREREQAICEMGTNALPYLLKWVRYETPPWKNKLYGTVNPALGKLKPSWQLSDEPQQLRANGAVFALITLCPKANGAVAELYNVLNDPTTSPSVRARVANVLGCIDHRSWNDPGGGMRFFKRP